MVGNKTKYLPPFLWFCFSIKGKASTPPTNTHQAQTFRCMPMHLGTHNHTKLLYFVHNRLSI